MSSITGGAAGPAGGDLAGYFPAPHVIGLNGKPLSLAAPSTSDVIRYSSAGGWGIAAGTAYNVQDFGAVGNNVNDDTAAIQAALNAAGPGGNVWVPYTAAGYLCGALTIPPGVRFEFANGAKLVAPAALDATGWLYGEQGVTHLGTAIVGGTFDASAVTSTAVYAVIHMGVQACPGLVIRGNRIINAPVHGIFASENSPYYTTQKKWIDGNTVDGYGMQAIGYGIFPNYLGSLTVARNFVGGGTSDGIELGRSGLAYLGINATMTCEDNVIVSNGTQASGQLQFPFCDGATIRGNTVIGNTIQNDGNTANNVTIIGNLVLNATPAGVYAGISVTGDAPVIVGNKVFVTVGDGIAVQGMKQAVVAGNYIYSSNTGGSSGYGITDTGSGGENAVTGNVIDGETAAFLWAISLTGGKCTVTGNVFTAGCAGGLTGGSPDSAFVGNVSNVTTTPIAAGGVGNGSVVSNNQGINPVGTNVPGTAFALPASGSPWTNNTGVNGTLYVIDAGTVSALEVQGAALAVPLAVGQAYRIMAGGTFQATYSAAPTLLFVGD